MHTTNRYSVGTCIHAAATAAATTTKTAMTLRILGSSVRNWWQGLGRNQSSATASSWVHENEQAANGIDTCRLLAARLWYPCTTVGPWLRGAGSHQRCAWQA